MLKKLKKAYLNFIGIHTHLYDYGKNNKVIFFKNGKVYKKRFLPKGLTIIFEGNNNTVKLHKNNKYENVQIDFEDNNSNFKLDETCYKLRDIRAYLEESSQISIGKNCQLKSRNLELIANCTYDKPATISIGDNVFIAKNVTIRTSDGHTLIDANTHNPLNPTQNVVINDNVWIGLNSTILKGANIPKGSVVGACSLVNKRFEKKNSLIVGMPAKVIKENITWAKQGYGTYLQEIEAKRENAN